eukprot:scaffold637_cov118-Isochrysis_galbana.AAC.5
MDTQLPQRHPRPMEERPRRLVGTTRNGTRLYLPFFARPPTRPNSSKHQSNGHKTEPPPLLGGGRQEEFRGLKLIRISDSDANQIK